MQIQLSREPQLRVRIRAGEEEGEGEGGVRIPVWTEAHWMV